LSVGISYRSGYKYQLVDDYAIATQIIPDAFVLTPFIRLDTTGELYIRSGYAWDGPSGPALDTKTAMRGSLVHDSLFQLMRMGLLPQTARPKADHEYYRICLEDGMWNIRAWLHFKALRRFAAGAAEQQEEEILSAP
jgi:hypothetical protein